jgi:hypothetical protein
MLQRLFKGDMTLTDNFQLKYEDSDKDLVSLENDDDLNLALTLSTTLKVYIHGNSPRVQ